MPEIPVAEQFYSIQGEGPYAGTPAIFLRLAGCNFQCGKTETDIMEVEPGDTDPDGDATWVCDTIPVWRKADRRYTPEDLAEEWEVRSWKGTLNWTHIVLTGGEPTLPGHQEAFPKFYYELKERDMDPFVEVETNGTQMIEDEFDEVANQYNVSLKLDNSGHTEEERLRDDAISQYVDMGPDRAMFKFVVSDEDDFDEILDLHHEYDIPLEQIMLMPAGQTQAQLRETYPVVAEICKEHMVEFSPRLHVDCWDQATGV